MDAACDLGYNTDDVQVSLDAVGVIADISPGVVCEEEKFDDSKKINIALNKLSEGAKEVVDMYYFQKCSHKDISEELEISENSSMLTLSRAKKKIREEYLKM